MDREGYRDICELMASGKEIYVRDSYTAEEARVEKCSEDHFLVKTRAGKEYEWDYHDCEITQGSLL
ncbi:MAG: hypothetical protein R2940_07430 [Syntrophotaleaceae bacterium]